MKIKKPKLSRKAKTLIYTSIVLLALTAVIAGNFPITPWNAFRLAEKAHLVGPAKIIGTESVVSEGQDGVIIAKSEQFCMTYAYKHFDFHDSDYLVCKKKTGDLTFLSISSQNGHKDWDDEYCSIILIDEYPQAVRAVLSLQPYIEFSKNGTVTSRYEKSYTVTATRKAEDYFFFRLDWEAQRGTDIDTWSKDDSLIYSLRQELNSNRTGIDPIPGKIQLYDKDNNLILEREIDLKNPNP